MGLLEKFYYNHILLRSLGWLFRIRSLTLWNRYNNNNNNINRVASASAVAAVKGIATDATASTVERSGKKLTGNTKVNKSVRNFLIRGILSVCLAFRARPFVPGMNYETISKNI